MTVFARARALVLTGIATLALGGLTACGTEEESGPPTDARMVFMHQARVLGSIDLLANGDPVATLALGELSDPVSVPMGSTLFELRNSGADVNVLDTSLDLLAQPYLVAVIGESLDDLRFWTVDDPAPALDPNQAATRVVNLDSGEFSYDVYLDDDLVAAGVAAATASDFTTLPLGEEARRTAQIRVFNAGSDPAGRPLSVNPSEVTLREGRAYMFVLRPDPEDPASLAITALSP